MIEVDGFVCVIWNRSRDHLYMFGANNDKSKPENLHGGLFGLGTMETFDTLEKAEKAGREMITNPHSADTFKIKRLRLSIAQIEEEAEALNLRGCPLVVLGAFHYPFKDHQPMIRLAGPAIGRRPRRVMAWPGLFLEQNYHTPFQGKKAYKRARRCADEMSRQGFRSCVIASFSLTDP